MMRSAIYVPTAASARSMLWLSTDATAAARSLRQLVNALEELWVPGIDFISLHEGEGHPCNPGAGWRALKTLLWRLKLWSSHGFGERAIMVSS